MLGHVIHLRSYASFYQAENKLSSLISYLKSVFVVVVFHIIPQLYSQTHGNANTTCVSQGQAYRHTQRTVLDRIWISVRTGFYFFVSPLYTLLLGGGGIQPIEELQFWPCKCCTSTSVTITHFTNYTSLATRNFTPSFGRFIRAYIIRSGLHQTMQQVLWISGYFQWSTLNSNLYIKKKQIYGMLILRQPANTIVSFVLAHSLKSTAVYFSHNASHSFFGNVKFISTFLNIIDVIQVKLKCCHSVLLSGNLLHLSVRSCPLLFPQTPRKEPAQQWLVFCLDQMSQKN